MKTDNKSLPKSPTGGPRLSLSAKVFALTIVGVLFAEAVVLVPSISKRRIDFYESRMEAAFILSLAMEAPEAAMISDETAAELFEATGIAGVSFGRDGARYLVYAPQETHHAPAPSYFVDLREQNPIENILTAWGCLIFGGDKFVSVLDTPAPSRGGYVEIIVAERELQTALLSYLKNILGVSLFISTLTAGVIFYAFNRIIVKPVIGLTQDMATFESDPEGATATRIFSERTDEIGDAERGLIALETRIRALLSERRRLAALGAGISKISHDLRNTLASAQLMSDRLAKSDDPRVRKLAPRLLSSLDRAVALSTDTLSYGRMSPAVLSKGPVNLHQLIDDVFDDAASMHVEFENATPEGIVLDADKRHFFRAIFNIVRNAVDAMAPDTEAEPSSDQKPTLKISAKSDGEMAVVEIADSGPGLPPSAIEHLFEPFKGSNRPGGSGLGVAIAHEIMRAHGGDLALAKSDATGATFELRAPIAH
ncbi:MAG: HAMP domain-containing sensor histidine kinase [Pseudomonadota bacterium]